MSPVSPRRTFDHATPARPAPIGGIPRQCRGALGLRCVPARPASGYHRAAPASLAPLGNDAADLFRSTGSAALKPNPHAAHPLGLPAGSVRALLTLAILGVVVSEVAQGQSIGVFWHQALAIALAHYFTSRRFVDLPHDALIRLEAEGVVERESNPLYLPRHTIRALAILTFAGLAAWLYTRQRLFQPAALTVLGAFAAYFIGAIARGITTWWTRGAASPPSRTWSDIKAWTCLLVMSAVAVAQLAGRRDWLPDRFEEVAIGLVLFYFGSR